MNQGDFKIYRQLVSDPKIARAARFRPAKDRPAAERLFSDDLNNAKSDAVTLNGNMIGMISLYPTISQHGGPDDSCLELADLMLPEYQDHGYMGQAVGILVKELSYRPRVRKVVALVNENNVPSRKVLERNHFVNYRSVLNMASGGEDLVYQLDV